MKTFKYISIFALTILLFNCSKSDDSSETPIGNIETLVIGKWKIESRTLNGEAVVLDCSNGLSSIITFTDTAISFGVDYEDGNGCDRIPYGGTYSIEGNLILFNDPWSDDTNTITVLSMNDTTFQTIYTSPDGDVTINTRQKV